LPVLAISLQKQRIRPQQVRHLPEEKPVPISEQRVSREHFRHVPQRGMLGIPYPFLAHHRNDLPKRLLNDLLLVVEMIVQITLTDPAILGNAIGQDGRGADPLLGLLARHKHQTPASCMGIQYSLAT
jgi:hypothetical protein